jgi:hypothetical protein
MSTSRELLLNRILRQGEDSGWAAFYAVVVGADVLFMQFLRA